MRPATLVIECTRAALEADPAWMPALNGLARALAQENPKAATQAGTEAEKLATQSSRPVAAEGGAPPG
jgi:hypothetical protein